MNRRSWRHILLALAIAGVALWLRLPAWHNLPYDIDERVYLPLAERYAVALEQGSLASLRDPLGNAEHPALAKMLFAGVVALQPGPTALSEATADPPATLHQARTISLAASVLLALLLAWRNPLAGIVFALSSWQIKYGVLVYLEAAPGLFAAGAILLCERWWQPTRTASTEQRMPALLLGSGLLLGASAAAKYPYALVAGGAVALSVVIRRQGRLQGWRELGLTGGIALLTLIALNPLMWGNPLLALRDSLQFHVGYSGNELVQSQQFRPWHNLALLFKPMPYDPFFPFSLFNQLRLEPWLTSLGLLSLPLLWRRSPVLGLWLALSLMFLWLWPTKWAHYTLMVIPALSLSAGIGATAVAGWCWRHGKLWYTTRQQTHKTPPV